MIHKSKGQPFRVILLLCIGVGIAVSLTFYVSIFLEMPNGVSISYHHLCPPTDGTDGDIALGDGISCNIQYFDLTVMFVLTVMAVAAPLFAVTYLCFMFSKWVFSNSTVRDFLNSKRHGDNKKP